MTYKNPLMQINNEHIHIDDENKCISLDKSFKDNRIYDYFLSDHFRRSNKVYSIHYVPFGDLNALKKQHNPVRQQPTKNLEQNARNRALSLLRTGADAQATDIHILKKSDHTSIQFRIKKQLMLYKEINNIEGELLIIALSRLCTSQDNTIKMLETQDGGISGTILDGTGLENIRLIRGPAYPTHTNGQHMELRLQYKHNYQNKRQRGSNLELSSPRAPNGGMRLNGYTEKQIEKLKYIASQPSGILILTGPTGSGKSTTIHQISKWKASQDPGRRLVSIEQPVELPMPWAVQLEISNALDTETAGKKFKEYLRNSLRMDPDDLTIAEIRDAEVALTAFEATQTGHSVMTTLHITDPYEFPDRLHIMDFERLSYKVTCNSSIITGVVGQRTLPLLCDHCKLPWSNNDARLTAKAIDAFQSWGDTANTFRISDTGCTHCQFTGKSSIAAVAEVIETDHELMTDYIHHGVEIARRKFRSRPDADTTMVEKAVGLSLSGTVDPFHIQSNVSSIPHREDVLRDRALGRRERGQSQETNNVVK